ncbi:MAG: hydroxymethylglutaryl-CoA lyase [Methylococcales bacterium]
MSKNYPDQVRVMEVSPRDGLQNISAEIPTATKIELINRLIDAGIKELEVASFVNPKWVPQMADAEQVLADLHPRDDVSHIVLTPNLKGLERALDSGVKNVAVFTAVSESFTKKNTNCTIDESLQRIEDQMKLALDNDVTVRGYVSCVLGCPYEGDISFKEVARISKALLDMGCYEVSLGDTIGIGTPLKAQAMLEIVLELVSVEKLALHFHDTRGQALANILACLEYGVSCIDASVAGLGGCPYAKGASGNVATEDVIYMLHGMGIQTGIDLEKLAAAGHYVTEELGVQNHSHVGNVYLRNN